MSEVICLVSCRAVTSLGSVCKNDAIIDGFCMCHFCSMRGVLKSDLRSLQEKEEELFR